MCNWLDTIDLGEYKDSFLAQAIDGGGLVALEKDDFVELGIKLGHQKKLVKEVKILQGVAE